MPKPHPKGRHPRALSPALIDQIIAYAVEHPTEGPRTIQARLRLERFGAWKVSHGSVYNVLHRAGLGRTRARLAAAEALSAAEGGPITERALRDIRTCQAILDSSCLRTGVRHTQSYRSIVNRPREINW